MQTKSNVTVQAIMSSYLVDVHQDDAISLVINLFEQGKISGAPVQNDAGEYIGVISKTDVFSIKFVSALKEQNRDISSLRVREFMSTHPLLTVSIHDSPNQAAEVMLESHVHRLFVKDDHGKLVGVVSSLDLLKYFRNPGDFRPVGSEDKKSGFGFWK